MASTGKSSIWLALLVTPSLALLNLFVAYTLVGPACEGQNPLLLHILSIGSLAICLLLTFLAWNHWQKYAILPTHPEDDASARKSFLPAVAAMAGLLSSFVIAAQWLPQWILSPCFA